MLSLRLDSSDESYYIRGDDRIHFCEQLVTSKTLHELIHAQNRRRTSQTLTYHEDT